MASRSDGGHPDVAKRNEAVAIELMKGGHPEGKSPGNPSQRSRSKFPAGRCARAYHLVHAPGACHELRRGTSRRRSIAPEAHAHLTKNEMHLHQHHVSAPNIYHHNQTVNVVNAGSSTDKLAAYASARRDAMVSQLQAGHTEEKGRLYQDALHHINECKRESMAKEQEYNEERQNWAAERNEAERKFGQLKILMELSNSKRKEEADRNMAEMRDITLKQSSDTEALRRELKARSVQRQPTEAPFSGLRPQASPPPAP